MFEKCLSKIKDDNGAAQTIEFLIMTIFLFSLTMTILDFGVFFNNRGVIFNAAGNGARLIAVFGGSKETSISNQYGVVKMTNNCRKNGNINSPTACSVFEELAAQKMTIMTTVDKIECGPDKTTGIGDRTYCQVDYSYHGLPGSALSLANRVTGSRTSKTGPTKAPYTVIATAESEVINRDRH